MMDASEKFKTSVSSLIAKVKQYRKDEDTLASVLSELESVKKLSTSLFNSTRDV